MGKCIFQFFVIVGTFFLFTVLTFAGTLNRNLEIVIVRGSEIADFNNVPLSELFLFAYRTDTESWEQISFQIDEKFNSGEYVYDGQTEDEKLDANDELTFMAKDAGDRNSFSWVDDLDSFNYVRIEIEVLDPLTSNTAYAYLYRSKSMLPSPDLTDYVKHVKSVTGKIGEDRIESLFYAIGNLANGLPGSLVIPQSAGGNGENIIDRLKFRAKASAFGLTVKLTESNLKFKSSNGDKIWFIDGPIRVIRKLDGTLNKKINIFFTLDTDFSGTLTFFDPYSARIEVEIPDISNDASISSGRLSIDFNSTVSGMKFTSAKNQNPVIVDGADDPSIDRTLDETVLPYGNWMAYESVDQSQGTIVNLFPVRANSGGARELYYKDKSKKDNGDSGDKRSYGDAGISLSGGIDTPDTLKYKGWFLGSQFSSAPLLASNAPYAWQEISSEIGNQIALWEKNPFQLTTTPQDFGTVPVELVAFQATVEGNDVFLSWQTATESNNFGFDIELSFANENWKKVGFVEGNGTTVQPKSYHFTLEDLQPGEYEFRLKQIDTDGAFEYSHTVAVFIGVPIDFVLQQNFPNPFNPATTISFRIPKSANGNIAKTSLKIYNLLGKEVVTLVEDFKSPGSYSVAWNAKDKNGLLVPSGIYLYRLQSGSYTALKKMILVK